MDIDRRNKYRRNSSSFIKTDKKLNINLDTRTLDIMCRSLVTSNQNLRRGQLINLRNLIFLINPDNYINDNEKSKRVSFIKKGIEARLDYNLTDPYMIITHIYGGILDSDIIDLESYQELSDAELIWMNDMISEALKFSIMFNKADDLMNICAKINSSEFGTKTQAVKEFELAINDIQNEFRRSKNEVQAEMMFSLQNGYFEDLIYDTHRVLSNPRRKLVTGMQGMNELLGGGFENGRCYVYFGLPGEGKSSTILNIIYQIKKYNKGYQTKDPTKRPCIVLLTMENTITESIERLFGMATKKSRLTDFTPDNVIEMFRNEGELYLNDESPIDIVIKFKPSNSVDTSYLYTLTEDLEDQGLECIAMFQDYIGRIRSTQRLQDTRLEYGTIVDEFKVYAELKDVPVITVAQLNRDAAKHIDEGRKASKSDLVRLLGRSNVSESMLILNNIDGGFLIAPEVTQSGERYLGVQRIKLRYDASDREFVYLPYINHTIKLAEDFNGIPTFKITMRDTGFDTNPIPFQSQYQTNVIVDMGQTGLRDEEDNIFSSKSIRSLEDLAAYKKVKPLIQPVIFDKR